MTWWAKISCINRPSCGGVLLLLYEVSYVDQGEGVVAQCR